MTISPSDIREVDIDTIIQMAYQLAGLAAAGEVTTAPGFSAKRAMAANFLDMIVKGLQADSILARHQTLEAVAVVASTATYALSSSILSLAGDAMFKKTGETTETSVKQMDLETYQGLSDKTSEGQPTLYYHQRTATQQVILWPVPDSAGTLTVQAHRLIADANDPQYTVDLERHWTRYLVWDLAHHLATASSLSEQRCGYLRSQAEKQEEVARNYSAQSTSFAFHLDHRTGVMRR